MSVRTTAKKAKGTKVVKKAIPMKPRSPIPDPSEEVFSVMDNIIDNDFAVMEMDSDEEPTQKLPMILLSDGKNEDEKAPKNASVVESIPYFNADERLLYTSPDYDIQHCVSFIDAMLTLDFKTKKSLVAETKILSLLNNISVLTSSFWTELAWSKDIISYKLNQRNFPTFQLIEKETTSEIDPEELGKQKTRTVITDESTEEASQEVSQEPLIPLNTPAKNATRTKNVVKKGRSKTPVKTPKAASPKPSAKSPAKKVESPPNLPITQNQEIEEVIRKKYDLGRPGGLQATLDQTYVDEGVTVTESGVRQYNVLSQEKYTSVLTPDMINHIFTVCNQTKAYSVMLSLFCRLCVSREFCHLALNKTVINIMFGTPGTPFNDPEYLEIIHHCMFYGFYLLYKEECTIKSMANPTHRCILDLETVQRFPIYDGALSENPYIPLTLSTKYLYAEGVPTEQYLFKPLRVPNTERGVYTLHSAQERFDVFTDGIFRGLNWDKLAMTGSLMPACVIRNPLERMFGINLPMTEDLSNPEAARAYWKNPANRKNLENYFDEYYPSKNILHSGYLNPEDPRYQNLSDATEKLSDIDIIVDFGDDIDFDRKVLEVFEVVKTNALRNHEEDPVRYPSAEVKMLKITTPNSYKYYIVGPGLHKNIELFRIFVHPLGCVSRFHFGCVRGTYHGDSIKLFPSMVSAAFTGILLEYKWMSSAKSTKDLVCKYYSRGYTIILNQLEHEAMRQHIIEHESRWGYMMAANDNERSISLMNPIFKPRQNRTGIYAGLSDLELKSTPNYKYTVPMANFDSYWVSNAKKSTYGFPLDFRFPAGHIQPPELWKLGPYITKLISSEKYN